MGGKAALILVLGFSSIMLMVALNMNRVAFNTVDNSTNHYEDGLAKEIARSGINLAASNLSRDNSWVASGSPYSYMGANNLEISVKDSGDVKILTSIGTYEDKSKLIEVKISIASFSEYAYFSNIEGNIWWTGNDTVWGPFHTNDNIQVYRHPHFAGPRTSHGGSMRYYSSEAADAPTIVGTYSQGVTIDIPTDGVSNLASYANSGGVELTGSEIFLEFAGDSIRYKVDPSHDYTTVLGTDFAPNGVIYANNADLRIQGTVKGKWSIGSNGSVYIDDDIVYSDPPDPMDVNDSSQDLLGIISQNDVIVTNNTANQSDINIHASIYCEDGSFTVENYRTRPPSGTINLVGGIIQEKRGPVGTFSRRGQRSGFNKNYKYDNRLKRMVPPYYPSTNTFKILSWLE